MAGVSPDSPHTSFLAFVIKPAKVDLQPLIWVCPPLTHRRRLAVFCPVKSRVGPIGIPGSLYGNPRDPPRTCVTSPVLSLRDMGSLVAPAEGVWVWPGRAGPSTVCTPVTEPDPRSDGSTRPVHSSTLTRGR